MLFRPQKNFFEDWDVWAKMLGVDLVVSIRLGLGVKNAFDWVSSSMF